MGAIVQQTRDRHNPRGYLELEAVKGLARVGAPWLAEARGRAVKVIHVLVAELPPGPEYRVVWIERPPGETTAPSL